MQTLGQLLIDKRKELGLSITNLARRLDISPETLRNWENNSHAPKEKYYSDLVELLGLDDEESMFYFGDNCLEKAH
jgi:transcriptional regulator with XRE-family HTH domain